MFKKSFAKGLLILTTLFFVITVVSLTSATASQECPMDVVFVIDDTGSMSEPSVMSRADWFQLSAVLLRHPGRLSAGAYHI